MMQSMAYCRLLLLMLPPAWFLHVISSHPFAACAEINIATIGAG